MIGTPKGKKVQIAAYLSAEQAGILKRLCDITRVPLQTYMGEAVDDLLKKYATTLRKGKP